MAREDLPPDFLQSPLLPGLEVAGNSGFVDSTAFPETYPSPGRALPGSGCAYYDKSTDVQSNDARKPARKYLIG